jgi:hypothetical protein
MLGPYTDGVELMVGHDRGRLTKPLTAKFALSSEMMSLGQAAE